MANPNSVFGKAGLGRLGSWWQSKPMPLPTPFEEQGSSGTAVWGGYVQVKEKSPDWIGQNKWRTSSDLAVDTSVVAAGVHYFLNLIAHPQWMAQPSDPNSSEAKEAADFVNNVLENMQSPWSNIVRQAGMHRFHGFSVQEWIAEKRAKDSMIGFANIESRPQHTIEQWGVDDRGTVIGVFQRNPQTTELLGLPRAKCVYIVENTLTDSPDGLGVLRHLAEPYSRLKRLLELEVRAYERDLRGIPVARAPLAAIRAAVKANAITSAQGEALIQGMKDLIQTQVKQSDTGILLDSQTFQSTTAGGPLVSDVKQWDIELLSGPGLGLSEIALAIDRIQREMARVIGVEHLMLGDGGGSRAVAQDKSRNVYLIASSVLRLIVSSMQNDIINPLWALNGLDDRIKPKLRAEDIAPKDVVEITTALARMSQSGAVLSPTDPAIDDVRDLLGISRAEKPLVDPTLSDEVIPGEPQPLPKHLSVADGKGNPADNGEAAAAAPHTNAEMQRLPRQTALNADPRAY